MPRMKWSHSWYRPGDWSLPTWWTQDIGVRSGRSTYAEQVAFYESRFVRDVLGHKGGITTLPRRKA